MGTNPQFSLHASVLSSRSTNASRRHTRSTSSPTGNDFNIITGICGRRYVPWHRRRLSQLCQTVPRWPCHHSSLPSQNTEDIMLRSRHTVTSQRPCIQTHPTILRTKGQPVTRKTKGSRAIMSAGLNNDIT